MRIENQEWQTRLFIVWRDPTIRSVLDSYRLVILSSALMVACNQCVLEAFSNTWAGIITNNRMPAYH